MEVDNDVPRDAKAMDLILKSMGVEEYEPRVINQLLEFYHRYVTEVLQDAQAYAGMHHQCFFFCNFVSQTTQAKHSLMLQTCD